MTILKQDFESVVKQHQPMLYRVAFNFLRNVGAAEEVVQEVFLKLYKRLDTIESAEHIRAWLRRAVTRQCIDASRLGSRRKESQFEDLPEVVGETPEHDPLLNERLRRLVGSLPEQQRLIVILRYGEDLDSEEIGAILNMRPSTVRTQLQRALQVLRAKSPQILGEEIHGTIGRKTP